MGGLFSKPKVKEPKEEVPVPEEDTEETEKAKRRSTAQQRARRGRQSTRLTETGGAGREYSRTTLG